MGNIPDPLSDHPQDLELRHHEPNDPSGFSASVFFDRSLNRYVLAIRGTEDPADIAEDIGRIGVQGYAGDQAVSLYRYYRQLTTPAGQPVNYSAAEMDLLTSMRLSLPVRISFTSNQESVFRSLLTRDVGLAPPDGSGGSVIPSSASLMVTGHSLGGHLALLFGRMFPSATEHVFTYNAPGINPLAGALGLRFLGIPDIDAAKVTNLASILGREAIALIPSKPGELIGVQTEAGSALYNHSVVPLADALALYGAFATLSPGLSSDADAIGRIIGASSQRPQDSLERTLDFLRKALGVESAPTLVASTLADLAQREDYYANLYGLLDSRTAGLDYGIVPLAGKPAQEIAALANSEVSVRYALRELMPFAVRQADYSAFADSQSAQWRGARAEMLAALISMNQADLPFVPGDWAENTVFDDRISGRKISLLRPADALLARQYLAPGSEAQLERFLQDVAYSKTTVFGADLEGAGEALAGSDGEDRLFAGTGDDRLDGGAGDDLLDGGSGADQLIGGAGADTLQGGEGADRLEGGDGMDTYLLAANPDADTIVDRDGALYAGATLLTGGSGGEDGVYMSGDGNFRYAFTGDLSSQGTLVVNGALRVEGFRNGDLGIRLTRESAPPDPSIPPTELTLLGDFIYQAIISPSGGILDLDVYGNPLPETRGAPAPGQQDLEPQFPGTPGNTEFVLGGGDDVSQDLWGGNDRFELGSGDDAAFGGSGDDLMEGGPGRDLLVGGRGNDVLIAGTGDTVAADLDEAALPQRSDSGDLLSGGSGDDVLIGDAEANLIEGGLGRDRIYGGSGADWIGADAAFFPQREVYQVTTVDGFPLDRPMDYLWGTYRPPVFSLIPSFGFGSGATANIGGNTMNPTFLDAIAGDADEIDAGPGDDTIAAGGGDDLVFGGAGNDYIDTGSGADRIYAGSGNDFIQASRDVLGDYVDAGDGDDVIVGDAGDDVFIGGRGNDRISSSGGSDVLLGGEGNDFLGAFGGSAIFDGGPGDDQLISNAALGQAARVRLGRGSGVDVLEARGGDLIVEILGGVSPQDVSVVRTTHDIPARDGGIGAFETLTGILVSIGAGQDALFLADIVPADRQAPRRIEFSDGTVWDDAHLQSLVAAPNAEIAPSIIDGSAAADLLVGTAGADAFTGGAGDDWLFGDTGDDTYAYAPGDGNDQIEDLDSTPGNTDALRFAAGIAPGDVGVFATGADFVLTAGPGSVRIRGGLTAEGAVERVEFSDGSFWSLSDLNARAEMLPQNRAPVMPGSLGSVAVEPGALVEFVLPGTAGSDPDRFDSVSLFAVTAAGERLPDWLHFDAAAKTLSGTPAAGDAGTHELLLIAADSSGAAAVGNLTIAVSGGDTPPDAVASMPTEAAAPPPLETPVEQSAVQFEARAVAAPPATSTEMSAVADGPIGQNAPAPQRREEFALAVAPSPPVAETLPRVGVPADPLFREMQQRFDVLLQTGRANLGDRYADAIREFEERRLEREQAPQEQPPSVEEIEAWNNAMHAWHDRNPGFAESDLGGNDGTWTMGWGVPAPSEPPGGGISLSDPMSGIRNPAALPRLGGAAPPPALTEGLRGAR